MADQDEKNLAATCGLYCGACSIHIAAETGDSEHLDEMARSLSLFVGKKIDMKNVFCEGCQSEVKAFHCRNCLIRSCAYERSLALCAECSDFPCERIVAFNNDGMRHHAEVLDNIRRQREIGVDAWLEEQKERWRCPECGCRVDWYARHCSGCDTALAGRMLKNLAR